MASTIEERLKEKLAALREKQSKDQQSQAGRKLLPLEQRIQEYKAKLQTSKESKGNNRSQSKSSKQSSQTKQRSKDRKAHGAKFNSTSKATLGQHPTPPNLTTHRPASASSRSRGPDDSTAPSLAKPKKQRTNALGKRSHEPAQHDSSSAEPSAAGATETVVSTLNMTPRDSDAGPPPETSNAAPQDPAAEDSEPWGPSRGQQRCANPLTTVFVGDLPMFMTSRELYEQLQEYGEVLSARVMGSQCYGFAEFKDADTCDKALAALESKPMMVNGEPLRIMRARGGMPQWQQGPAIVKRTAVRAPYGLESYEHPTAKKARYGFRDMVKDTMLRQELEGVDVPKGRHVIAYDDI